MNIEQFTEAFKEFKDVEKIEIECDHPDHDGDRKRVIGKAPARRNILKHAGKCFVCRDCCMSHSNPTTHRGERRQSDEIVSVECPDCGNVRDMKSACHYGAMEGPYMQRCGSCAQRGKPISDEQRRKTSETMKGIPKSDGFKENLSEYMKARPERHRAMLEAGSSRFAGKHHTPEAIEKIRVANTGKVRTPEQRRRISEGRRRMLAAQGGLLPETRAKISRAMKRLAATPVYDVDEGGNIVVVG